MDNVVGIAREHKSKWERRTPVVPHNVEELNGEYGINFVVQPASNRVYDNTQYVEAGARLSEDLTGCKLVVGIKEMPLGLIRRNGAYMFFSHTIKGQKYNMELLSRLVELDCTLIDYELVKDEKGKRLIFFGNYAGMAGMIDSLWALGRRLRYEGYETPFLGLEQAFKYRSLDRAGEAVRDLLIELKRSPLPEVLRPMMIGFAGYGNVSKGAQAVFDILEPEEVAPEQIKNILSSENGSGLYKVVFKEEHIVTPKDSERQFDLHEYYDHPELYRSVFESYVPDLTVLMNCNYWDERYPRLITKDHVKSLYSGSGENRLKVIGDISCDPEGGIECTLKCTQPDNPVYVFDPNTGIALDGWEGHGPVILAVDNLPAEFPRESSEYFSGVLMNYLPVLIGTDFNTPFHDIPLPDEIKGAIILFKGEFTPAFRYMEKFIRRNPLRGPPPFGGGGEGEADSCVSEDETHRFICG